ncbi:MAG: hypothetical protein JWM85_1201, partial [Acidimicrobiaceae bacterium]|nr:hypothetical protein [Acidimicrobiaceae bacterium]
AVALAAVPVAVLSHREDRRLNPRPATKPVFTLSMKRAVIESDEARAA